MKFKKMWKKKKKKLVKVIIEIIPRLQLPIDSL